MKKIYFLTVFLFLHSFLFSQGKVGINVNNPRAALEIQSDSLGILIPKFSNAQLSNIHAIDQMLIFNTTERCFQWYDSTQSAWICINGGTVTTACDNNMLDRGSYCIDIYEQGPLEFLDATLFCRNRGMYICTLQEWYGAADWSQNNSGGMIDVIGNDEWTSDIRGTDATIIGNANINNVSYTPWVNPKRFRCCIQK